MASTAVEVQQDKGGLIEGTATEVEAVVKGAATEMQEQVGRGGQVERAAAEVRVQLGRESSVEGPAGDMRVEGAAAEVEKATLSNLL